MSNVVAIDCEMAGVSGGNSAVIKVSIVNEFGEVLLDKLVRPADRIVQFRSFIHGIYAKDLRGAEYEHSVRRQVINIINGKLLVGHDVKCDLKALRISHPEQYIRDISQYVGYKNKFNEKQSLKFLAKNYLGRRIQTDVHDSLEDARAAMDLYLRIEHLWR